MQSASQPQRNHGLLVGLAVCALGALALLAFSFDGAAVWSTTVDELLRDPGLRGRRVRVEGTLVAGSLMKRDQPCEYRFDLKSGVSVVHVRYPQCVIPDSLRDIPDAVVKVTVVGVLGAEDTFGASQVLAKCPSKYSDRPTH